jgi:hypothetical protein
MGEEDRLFDGGVVADARDPCDIAAALHDYHRNWEEDSTFVEELTRFSHAQWVSPNEVEQAQQAISRVLEDLDRPELSGRAASSDAQIDSMGHPNPALFRQPSRTRIGGTRRGGSLHRLDAKFAAFGLAQVNGNTI